MPIDPKLRALLFRGPDTGKQPPDDQLESAAREVADQPEMYTPPLPVPLSARPTHRAPGERGIAEPPWLVNPPAALPAFGTLVPRGTLADEGTTFSINSIRIDNLTAQWVYFPSVGVWVPPFWYGRILRYDGSKRKQCWFETPPGITANGVSTAQVAVLTFYEEMLIEVDGESLTGTINNIIHTPGIV